MLMTLKMKMSTPRAVLTAFNTVAAILFETGRFTPFTTARYLKRYRKNL